MSKTFAGSKPWGELTKAQADHWLKVMTNPDGDFESEGRYPIVGDMKKPHMMEAIEDRFIPFIPETVMIDGQRRLVLTPDMGGGAGFRSKAFAERHRQRWQVFGCPILLPMDFPVGWTDEHPEEREEDPTDHSYLYSDCGKNPCTQCQEPVKQGPGGRWYITMGHPGFNSPANNGLGYATKGMAVAAYRRYKAK